MTLAPSPWHQPPDLELRVVRLDQADLFRHDQLQANEASRAAAFASEALARRYVACRVGLRQLLAARLGIAPKEVELRIDAYGKPRLAAPRFAQDLRFSVARCGERALVAIARGIELGVDLDHLDRLSPDVPLPEHALTPAERRAIHALAPEQRRQAFLHFWVRKEAVLKATGSGLSIPPHRVNVGSLDSPAGEATVRLAEGGSRIVQWEDVVPPGLNDHAAALAWCAAAA